MNGKHRMVEVASSFIRDRGVVAIRTRIAAIGLAAVLVVMGPSHVARAGLLYGTQGGSILAIDSDTGAATTFASGFGGVGPLAVDPSGNVYAAVNGVIEKFTPGGVGSVFAAVPAGGGMAFDASGNLYAVNENNSTIERITSTGVVSTFATGVANANEAAGMAFDGSGNLYLAAGTSIEKFTSGGMASTFYAGSMRTIGLAVDSLGNVYVGGGEGDYAFNISVTEITPGGVASTYVSGLFGTSSLAFDPSNNLYIADGYSAIEGYPNTLIKVTPSKAESVLVSSTTNPVGFVAFAPQSVPEPSSLVLLGMGAVGVLGSLRLKAMTSRRAA